MNYAFFLALLVFILAPATHSEEVFSREKILDSYKGLPVQPNQLAPGLGKTKEDGAPAVANPPAKSNSREPYSYEPIKQHNANPSTGTSSPSPSSSSGPSEYDYDYTY